MTVRITKIVGNIADSSMHEAIHQLEHEHRVEYVTVAGPDLSRKRLRVATDKGTDCAISLSRDVSLEHGDVLLLEPARAIVVQLEELAWMTLEASDRAASVLLGFVAGHHHWRIKLEGARMRVALDQPQEAYLDRIEKYLDCGDIVVVTDDD